MRTGFWTRLALLVSLELGGSSLVHAAIAVDFGQQPVDESHFIVLAAPGGRIGYQLLILEQLKETRPCWNESGSDPSTVDPLLLNFNFTGICDRKTDSNGYSVRVGGQDLALQYSLRLVQQDNDLVLIAESNHDRDAVIEVGRTHGIPNGFSRIILEPGWHLARRTYNGKPVGHIYLTNDQPLDALLAASSPNLASSNASQPAQPAPTAPLDSAAPTDTSATSTAPAASPDAAINSTSTAPDAIDLPPTPSSGSSSAAPSPAAPSLPAPASTSSSTSASTSSPQAVDTAPMNSSSAAPPPAFTSPTSTPPPPQSSGASRSSSSTLPPILVPTTPAEPTPTSAEPNSSAQPSSDQASTQPAMPPAPDQASTDASPQQASTSGVNYQVVVMADTPELQRKVRAVTPDASMININGQSVMQAGVFRDRADAVELQQKLSREGLSTAVIEVNGSSAN